MSGRITDLSRTASPGVLTTEICIIGSGCGGATAARDLAEAGRDVMVLEEGGDFTGEQLTQRDAEMYDQLYMDRAGRTTDDLLVNILQGRVLGGGAVVNACDVVPVPDGVYEFWRRRYGLGDFAPKQMRSYSERALQDLGVNRIDEGQLNRANRLLRQGAQALGYRGEVMRHNRLPCPGLGTCFLGCPVNAKLNPRFVAIPKAIAAGADVYTRARAVRIEQATSEMKLVHVRLLDSKGYHQGGELEVRAKIVILAANAISSAQLLLRSGIGNEHVGQHLILQPQLNVSAFFKDEVGGFRGIPQAYAVTEFEEEDDQQHGLWGFRVEAVFGTPGMAGSLYPYTGMEGKDAMVLYPKMASSLVLVPDEPSGTVKVTGGGDLRIQYLQRENHQARLREGIKAAARIYLAAGAIRMEVPVIPALVISCETDLAKVDSLRFKPGAIQLISAHQQGTVRFAPSASDGGANPEGEVYGTRDIYVFDSSGFPSSSSSHTMAPIMAISHYLSDRLLSRLG